MKDRKILELFLQNVRDEALYYDEEDFDNFMKEMYDNGKITQEQYETLDFDMVKEKHQNKGHRSKVERISIIEDISIAAIPFSIALAFLLDAIKADTRLALIPIILLMGGIVGVFEAKAAYIDVILEKMK